MPEHVELRLNGFTIGLGTVEAARGVHGVEAAPGSPAMVLVVWTDDVDEAYRDLVAAGVPTIQPPHDTGNNNRNALLRDPDGNLVKIVARVCETRQPDHRSLTADEVSRLSFVVRKVSTNPRRSR